MPRRSVDSAHREVIVGIAVARWNFLPWAILAGVLAFAAFAPTVRYGWVGWDDEAYVTTSPLMSAPDGLRLIWASTEADQYYPLTFTLLRLQYKLFERDPAGYHATCVLLHAIDAILLLWALRSLGLARGICVAVALLFAVHPMQAMSVAWVAQQKNLLSCAFVLLAIQAWTRFRQSGGERWYLASLVAFAAALLSKTAVLTLPLALIGIDLMMLGRRVVSSIVRCLPMFVMGAAAIAITVMFEKPFVGGLSLPGLLDRILIAGGAVWFYGVKLLCPINLLPIYPLWGVSTANVLWWLPLGLALAVVVLLWRLKDRVDRHIILGLWLFLTFILPMLGLVPFGNMSETYVSDHYVYIASIGFFVAAAAAVFRLLTRIHLRLAGSTAILGLAVAGLMVATWRYEPVFHDVESMWTRVVEENPTCFMAHAALGQNAANEGHWAAAIDSYQKALEQRPDHIPVKHALARAQMRLGQFEDAKKTLLQLTEADESLPGAAFDLGHIAEGEGRYDEAIHWFQRAAQLDPQKAEAHIRLGRLYLGLSRTGQAEEEFTEAIRVEPDNPWGYLGLATCRRGAGKSGDAVSILKRGLARSPENVALINLLARILATDRNDTVRDGARAVQLAKEAERLTAGSDCLVLDTLAAAYAEIGDFPQAVATAERAAALAESQGYTATTQQLRQMTAHYREGNVLRESSTNITLQ